MELHPHQLMDIAEVKSFLLAGDAYITLKSKVTQNHYTFRVSKAEKRIPVLDDPDKWFVSVLSDNDGHYTYVGMIDPIRSPTLRRTKATKFSDDAGCVRAFRFFYDHLQAGHIPPNLEVWHEGRCGRCGRQLTVPESIERGIGPECAAQMGLL